MEKKLGVNVFGFIGGEFGLGEAVRLIIKALNKAEIPVSLINYEVETNHQHNDKTFNNFSEENIHPINLVLMGPSEAKRVLTHYPDNFFKNKYNIFYLNWESEYIPQEYIDNLSFYDEIWVPAQYCKEILEGFCNIPVYVVPYPIEIDVDHMPDVEADSFYKKDRYNFFFMFDYNSSMERKNTINLIRAFERAFGKEDKGVMLTIKTSKSARFIEEKKILESYSKDFKNIRIIEKIYDKQTLHKIIKGCDAYISLHRSEGFGLTMAEAMFFGKPVIATNYSGNLEFMNNDNSFLVDSKKTQISSSVINYDSNTIWSEPDVVHAAELMRDVRANTKSVHDKAMEGQQSIHRNFSSTRIADIISNRIKSIFQHLKPNPAKDELITLYIENIILKNELRIYRKSVPIQLIYDIKMFIRNRKKDKG